MNKTVTLVREKLDKVNWLDILSLFEIKTVDWVFLRRCVFERVMKCAGFQITSSSGRSDSDQTSKKLCLDKRKRI